MRLFFLLTCVAITLSAPLHAQRERAASIRGILVAASSAPGKTDERLQPYEATLRRILRFESFRFLGEGRAAVAGTGEATLLLGQNHRLELHGEGSGEDPIRVQVEWLQGQHSLMRTGLVLRPGVPAVLGGPSRGADEVFAVILVAQ